MTREKQRTPSMMLVRREVPRSQSKTKQSRFLTCAHGTTPVEVRLAERIIHLHDKRQKRGPLANNAAVHHTTACSGHRPTVPLPTTCRIIASCDSHIRQVREINGSGGSHRHPRLLDRLGLHVSIVASMSAKVRWMSLPNVEHRGCEHVARCSGTGLVWYSSRNMYGAVAGAWEGSPSQGWTPRPPGAKQSVRSCKHGAAQHHARAAKLRLGRLAHALGKGCSTWRVTEGATWSEESRSGRIALSRVVDVRQPKRFRG